MGRGVLGRIRRKGGRDHKTDTWTRRVEEGAAGCNFVEGVSSLIFSGIIIGGAFSHSAGTAPIITVIIQVTALKTTPPAESCTINSNLKNSNI